jgi:transcriptional regulator with XRE-family HTH domain
MPGSIPRDRLRLAREDAGLTQQELANAIGVSRVTVVRWEGGRQEPSLQQALWLADVLDTTVDELFGDPERVAERVRVKANMDAGVPVNRAGRVEPDTPGDENPDTVDPISVNQRVEHDTPRDEGADVAERATVDERVEPDTPGGDR